MSNNDGIHGPDDERLEQEIPEGTEAAVKGRTFAGPLKVSYEWTLKEFSITPIGADTLAKVRSLCAGPGGRLATPRR